MKPSQAPDRARFGVFEADLRSGELRRNGVKVRLQDLPFRALALLLSRPGELITREEFRQALWASDVFVDFEQGISSAIMRLRDALGDSADNPIFVQTIERRGYRWVAPVLSQTPESVTPEDAAAPLAAQAAEQVASELGQQPESNLKSGEFTARYEIGLTSRPKKGTTQVYLWLGIAVVVAVALA